MNVQDIRDKTDGEVIVTPGLTARCIEVGQRKTGSGNYGDWSGQQLMLEDNTGKIRVQVWNHPDLTPLKGKVVTVQAHKGDNGWGGCNIEDQERNGQRYKQIKLASNGELFEPTGPIDTQAPTPTPVSGNGAIPWTDYETAMRRAHKIAYALEPSGEDGPASAAIVNTMMISFSQGRIGLPRVEDDPGPEPGQDDDINF